MPIYTHSSHQSNDSHQRVAAESSPYRRRSQFSTTAASQFLGLFFCLHFGFMLSPHSENSHLVTTATSINYGISQQPITDINQLMPKLCQNQSVICEGSYCISGVKKCVCDLRMPVQFGRFCLRQVDIETKCFVTNQCNHTIKDAVCIDLANKAVVLSAESSKFKLEQWNQLNELRLMSQSTLSKDVPKHRNFQIGPAQTQPLQRGPRFLLKSELASFNLVRARDEVAVSKARNSPYEINYNTPELLLQNHTRRRTNNSDRSSFLSSLNAIQSSNLPTLPPSSPNPDKDFHDRPLQTTSDRSIDTTTLATTTMAATTMTNSLQTSSRFVEDEQIATTVQAVTTTSNSEFGGDTRNLESEASTPKNSDSLVTTTIATSTAAPSKKMITKSQSWPPGICSCPNGFMFESMLRKCLALSLADSHCQVDLDCKQIPMTHCSLESKKCECDEPLVWDQKELACVRPKPSSKSEAPKDRAPVGFVENLLPPLVLAKLFPDYTIMLLIFVIAVIVGTLIILKLTVKCFSSSSSALISPKNKRKKPAAANHHGLPPRSPYATLRRPDHKPSSHLSNFTQATRGRILNYDFEQEGPAKLDQSEPSPSPQPSASGIAHGHKDNGQVAERKTATLKANKTNQKQHQAEFTTANTNNKGPKKQASNEAEDQLMDLNDNISISQLESESKSDNSILTIPGPPPTQQPPYMLASAMKGQGSAIAAAAAAVANKRMQMAQKKSLEQQQSASSGRLANGSPVFL